MSAAFVRLDTGYGQYFVDNVDLPTVLTASKTIQNVKNVGMDMG